MFYLCYRPSSILCRYTHCNMYTSLKVLHTPIWLICVCRQGKEPSVRQLALLHFRNIITLNLKLDEALSRPRARVPPSIIQMLLILQVNTPKNMTELKYMNNPNFKPQLQNHKLNLESENTLVIKTNSIFWIQLHQDTHTGQRSGLVETEEVGKKTTQVFFLCYGISQEVEPVLMFYFPWPPNPLCVRVCVKLLVVWMFTYIWESPTFTHTACCRDKRTQNPSVKPSRLVFSSKYFPVQTEEIVGLINTRWVTIKCTSFKPRQHANISSL